MTELNWQLTVPTWVRRVNINLTLQVPSICSSLKTSLLEIEDGPHIIAIISHLLRLKEYDGCTLVLIRAKAIQLNGRRTILRKCKG